MDGSSTLIVKTQLAASVARILARTYARLANDLEMTQSPSLTEIQALCREFEPQLGELQARLKADLESLRSLLTK